MKDDYMKLLVVVVLLAVAGIAVYKIYAERTDTTKTKGYEIGKHSGGWLSALFDNAANIVDAGGRHTSSFVTSLGNTVSQIISTSKNGKYVYQQYGYSDPKIDYGPYVLGGAFLITAGVVAALTLKK